MAKYVNKYDVNQKFGMLTIIKYLGIRKYLCKCDCGNETIARSRDFSLGSKKSCGCLRTVKREGYIDNIKQILLNSIKISKKNCWEWQKSKHRQGYGHVSYNGKLHLAHRISWIIFKGEIQKGKKILHKCDNQSCINPDHLFVGSQKENMIDMFAKNRSSRQKLTSEQANEIRLLYSKNICTIEICKKFGVSRATVSMIVNNKIWKPIKEHL